MQKNVPPALNKFCQKKSKGKAKSRALTTAELAAAARNTRKRRRGLRRKQMTQEVSSINNKNYLSGAGKTKTTCPESVRCENCASFEGTYKPMKLRPKVENLDGTSNYALWSQK